MEQKNNPLSRLTELSFPEQLSPAHIRGIVRRNWRAARIYIFSAVKWTVLGVIMGALSGVIGSAFHTAIEYVSAFHLDNPWTLYLLPLLGVVLVFSYRACNQINDRGTNQIIDAVTKPEKASPQLAPLIFLASVLTHLGGGSAGREGAALQIGGSIGATFGKLFHLEERDLKVLTMCGMSAVFSSLFGTPIAAAIFSLEVISIGIMYYSALYPCLLASITAYAITGNIGVEIGADLMTFRLDFQYGTLALVILLAALSAVVSILFCIMTGGAHKCFHKYIKNDYARILVGAACIILLTLAYGTNIYNGAGMATILKTLAGDPAGWEMWLLKMILTAVTIGCGFRGGEIVPCMFVGATFGSFAGALMGMDPGFAAAVGLIAVFCGCVNCPIASITLAAELFGATDVAMMYFAIACAISYTLSGYFGVYTSQRFNYSKLQVKYLQNRPTAKH